MTVDRGPLTVRDAPRRTPAQRLALRFPALAAANARLVAGLAPGSRLRHALVWRGVRLSLEAYNRRDLDAVHIGSHPEIEYRPARPLVESGLMEESYRGRDGYRAYVANTTEVWGDVTRIDPVELIDLGDRGVLLAYAPMRALGSGVELTLTFAMVSTIEHGLVTRIQEYHDHGEALRAVGLER